MKRNKKNTIGLQNFEREIRSVIEYLQGNQSQAATLLRRGIRHPPDERKEGDTMITYSDLIQFCIFIVALVGLCYEMFKGKRK